MPVWEIVLWSASFGLSLLGTGLFLRIDKQTLLLSALMAAVTGSICMWLLPQTLQMAAGPYLGLPLAVLYMTGRSRRPAMDGLLAFAISAGYWRLWAIFQWGLAAVCETGAASLLYGLFFLLHLPALLATFPAFSVPAGWQAQLQGRQNPGLRIGFWPALGVALLLMLELTDRALPAGTVLSVAAKILLAAALFWAVMTILVLLTAYSRRYQQGEAESTYRSEMTTFMNVVRSQRHDYNLYVQTVASLIARQKWEECRSYVDALVQDTAALNAILPIKDPAVAALIGHFKALAAQRGIVLQADIRDDMARVATSAYETNKIIGNLLQNALDELDTRDEQTGGRIELTILKRGEYCLIRVSNRVRDKETFLRNQENLFRQGYTTKYGHDGVGLSSIRALTRQAGGDISVWMEGDTAHFVASLPMHYSA